MDHVLAGLHWETCLFYLDNIIVFTATWEEHLARLRHAKLKLGADKCTFATREVSYLGHRVTEEGLLPDPALLAAIREISQPQNATEVRSFLGLAGYYRRYVKKLRSHRRTTTCPDPEGRGLPLEHGLPGRLRPPQNAPHH